MEGIDHEQDRRVDRRTFLKSSLIAGGAVVAGGAALKGIADGRDDSHKTPAAATARRAVPSTHSGQPNILVIMVDQMRYPQWFSTSTVGLAFPPNIERIRNGGVSFERHYTASNDCTPARSTLLTGLYTHQTGCMITGGSTLDPGFPTWGSMLREHAYETWWFGKWHLTHGDGQWNRLQGEAGLEPYGFAGGVFPSPDGGPGQGSHVDPRITRTFVSWLAEQGQDGPWCTTVSFVNPHDIAWWYLWSDRVASESSAQRTVAGLPPNYETPELLIERAKPRLQRSLQDTAAVSFGPVPFTGPESSLIWLEFLDLYTKLQRVVDRQIGKVLDALESRPEMAANTIVVFTSDHGEYAASHGLRGKGAAAYEEGIRVPLIVKDPRGQLTSAPETSRSQLTSSVDVAPLLLTIGSGSDAWRSDPQYAHLAGRADLAAILADPNAPGRDYVLHATDEALTEFAVEPYAANAPLHLVAVRTDAGKLGVYTDWSPETTEPIPTGQESELYDYSTASGRMELHNALGASAIEESIQALHAQAVKDELRETLPVRLQEANANGYADYFQTAKHAATNAASRRRQRDERLIGSLESASERERLSSARSRRTRERLHSR